MKKHIVVLSALLLLVFAFAGDSQAWQGRMGGMEDPYGLVSDESDFLIHPAKIAKGEGIRFYGDYRFTYGDMFDNDIDVTIIGLGSGSLDLSGDEWWHDALVGAGFPLGPGRMGVFFNYEGRRNNMEGDIEGAIAIEPMRKLDDFALRLLYGLPLGSFRIGGELGFAYYQEEQEFFLYPTTMGGVFVDFIPYDTAYWEIPFRAGVEGVLGPLDVEFSLRGGWIVSGDNTLSVGIPGASLDLDGDVEGWRIGGDLWLRYSLGEGLSLPFLVRVDYREKRRDGDGSLLPFVVDIGLDYEHLETSLHLTAGGGLNKELAQGTRIAAGIYYNYLQDTANYSLLVFDAGVPEFGLDFSDLPTYTEHRATVRLAGEHEFSPVVAVRIGLECFYGWGTEDMRLSLYDATDIGTLEHSLDGSHWGIGASLGGTIKVQPITLEPFFNVGYQSLDLSGDGEILYNGALLTAYDWDGALLSVFDSYGAHNAWYIGGGLSVLFDL